MLSCELEPARLIELGQLAEETGYEELWYTDQRFWRDCYAGLTLLAQNTSRLRLGPGVNDPFTRHPATIAMAIATLDELSGRRAQLGMGVGGSGIAQMHLRKERPVRALREAIELIRLLLAGGPVTFDGEIFPFTGGRLGFEPPRCAIPIVVATHSPMMLKVCGRIADGVLLGNLARPEAIANAIAIVREGERDAGRPPGSVAINLRLEALIADDRLAAHDQMRARVASRFIATYPNWDFLGDRAGEVSPALMAAVQAKDVAGTARLLTEADVQATALVGDANDAALQLAGLLSPEIARVTIRPYGYPGHDQAETIRAFATRVWPAAWQPAVASGS
jgi:5,10-methylenetetrahydromethanopterin reductase